MIFTGFWGGGNITKIINKILFDKTEYFYCILQKFVLN